MGRSTTSCFKIISCGGSDESVDKDDINVSSQNKGPDKRGWSFRKRSARHRVLSNTVVTEIPSSENKESSITELPSSENKEISITEIPSLESKGISVTEIPSSESKGISVTEIPSSDSKGISVTEIPSSESKGISVTKIPSSDSKEISVTEIPSSENKGTEIPSSEHKECSEPVTISSESVINPAISEKNSEDQWTEEIPQLSNSITKDSIVSTMTNEAVYEDDIKSESVPDESAMAEAVCEDDIKSESAILVIQAAVRRFLAQRELVKHKNIVKLQAAVRGHLVRNHAVGSLRCVQAIVKMQTLVRARHANLSAERSAVGEKGVQNPGINSQSTYISIEKLLSNKLARQLLESTPKTKQINIKCDPLKPNSAWNWLERWMSVSTPETIESQDQNKVKNKDETVTTIHCESTDMKSNVGEASVPSSAQENSIVINKQDSILRNNEEEEEKPQPDSSPDETMHLNSGSDSIPEKPVSETEPKRPAKRFATDQPDSEGRKTVFGSRKASNPAFIAAQSRFEELTSKTNPLKSVDSFNQDNETGLSADTGSSAPENSTIITDVEPQEHSVSHSSPMVPNSGSECGTELSITSTLDSPDQSEAGNKKSEEEAKVLDETEKLKSTENVEQKLLDNNSPSDADIELEPESGHQVYKSNEPMEVEVEVEHETVNHAYNYKSSGEASPRSHITIPESQGTPSSQVSTNTKKTRTDKKVSSQKRKSWSTSKKSTVTSSPESGLRSSLEQLPKESKPGKRRNSFGSPRPADQIDQEARDSSSVPSYMQATESARAKAIANSSPRSSPDVQDKETYLKKRHSLPGAVNGRQGSPRIQRSMSQALQSTKGNSSQERKWQR